MSELDMCTDVWKDMCTRIISVMNQKTKQGHLFGSVNAAKE